MAYVSIGIKLRNRIQLLLSALVTFSCYARIIKKTLSLSCHPPSVRASQLPRRLYRTDFDALRVGELANLPNLQSQQHEWPSTNMTLWWTQSTAAATEFVPSLQGHQARLQVAGSSLWIG